MQELTNAEMMEVLATQESTWRFPENNAVRHWEDGKTKTKLSSGIRGSEVFRFFCFVFTFILE